jgi:hypothetical protein
MMDISFTKRSFSRSSLFSLERMGAAFLEGKRKCPPAPAGTVLPI